MPPQILNLDARINVLTSVLTTAAQRRELKKELRAANGDWAVAMEHLGSALPEGALRKVALAHSLAEWSGDNVPVVKALVTRRELSGLRDVALHFNAEKLAEVVDASAVPEGTAGATDDEKRRSFAAVLNRRLFAAEPAAVLHRMVRDAEVPIASPAVRTGVTRFLANQPDYNLRITSIYTALRHPDAMKGIAADQHTAVLRQLKDLQRVVALSPIPEAVPVLLKHNLTSALRIGEIPESTFLTAYGKELGDAAAREVYTAAINSRIRNENALMGMKDVVRGTGLAIIDDARPKEHRMRALQTVLDEHNAPLNLEALFGSIDYCECEECTSVYSPAAYFVDLLQYLRNNNLKPKTGNPPSPVKGIDGTPLDKLFHRRPDLGCLELTCANTNTVLPYIDLVNEVMESFVVHLDDYHADTNDPKQAKLDVFNVLDETSSELLAQPQHINYDAYCLLKNAVHPFSLPYHQPIDAIRIFLNYLGTSRHELLDTYPTAHECPKGSLPPAKQQDQDALHETIIDRAVDAEFLGLTLEEYIILTRAAFWPKQYFDITLNKNHSDDEYRHKIGVRPVPEYYGYLGPDAKADMLTTDEAQQKGLTFVKRQFLPRTGVLYVDLVELLKTQYLNPNFPRGRALAILESIRYSYRYLQTLLDPTSDDPRIRFAKLIALLEQQQARMLLQQDPCKQQKPDWCINTRELRNWVICYFDKIGKLIVLESGDRPLLQIEGDLYQQGEDDSNTVVGHLDRSGTIFDMEDNVVGTVGLDSKVKWTTDGFGGSFDVVNPEGEKIGEIEYQGDGQVTLYEVDLRREVKTPARWTAPQDTCDLTKVRLVHLDGTPLTVDEYDRMQRFIRLWRKLGWTIDVVDKALVGLSGAAAADDEETPPGAKPCTYMGFDAFVDNCAKLPAPPDDKGGCCDDGDDGTLDCSSDDPSIPTDITPAFLHQLVAVRKLLDRTGLPLPKLLALWADISTAGEKSLYAGLFLTHNLLSIDKVFKADNNGNYLTQQAKITEHIPVLMAALKLKADDITAIMGFRKLTDALTLQNVSVLYRHSLLAKLLNVRIVDLPEVFALLDDPFRSAHRTLWLLDVWGRMEDAGFTFGQLNYVIRDRDDALRPLAPSKQSVLLITKALYDGLNGIDRAHHDVAEDRQDEATADLVRTKAALVFDLPVVELIVGLLEGTTLYTTNAPPNLTISIPDPLSTKLKYSTQKDAVPPGAAIQVTGLLTQAEQTQAKALSTNPDWIKAIHRVGKQASNFFDDVLFGIFPDQADAKKLLLAGDASSTDAGTALAKRIYFLQHFLPFLRKRLAHRLIVDTMAGAASLAGDVTDLLLSDILVAKASQEPAIEALEKIKQAPQGPAGWKGYLIPQADDDYIFVAIGDTQPASLLLGGQVVPFPYQQEDPSNVWSSDPVKLKSGTLYWLEVIGQDAGQLQWKTATSPKAGIPAAALLPDYSRQGTEEVFAKLYKAAILVSGFSLNADETGYLQTHAADFDAFNWNAITLAHWRRLQAYVALRDGLPKNTSTLLDLFRWATQPDASKLSEKIAAVTGWKPESIDKLITADHFDLNRPEAFRNEVNLVTLHGAMAIADKIGVGIDPLFEWAKPTSKFWVCHQIAEDIRKAIRARYDQEDWEQVIKPLNDKLRENQKQALISHLLVQQDLLDWGVIDADSLFEFFLIDVQMDACMETSRIKQAISTVQLFIQRCLLGQEERGGTGVPPEVLDRDRWEWMQRYRVWEANRKVFLYPENWIDPQLRDDKSPFYKELESELLQKDISQKNVEDALKSYLFKVDEVANLKVVGLHLDAAGEKVHVFGRTRNAPYFYFYRYFSFFTNQNGSKSGYWYPWERVQVDIPSYDVEGADGKVQRNGAYLVPVAWNRRQLIFFPQLAKKTLPPTNLAYANPPQPPTSLWEIKLAWSEYRNGKWTQKQVSADALYSKDPFPDPSVFEFIPRISESEAKVVIDVHQSDLLGSFHFAGSMIYADPSGYGDAGTIDTDFHYKRGTSEIHSLQAVEKGQPGFLGDQPYFVDGITSGTAIIEGAPSTQFYHPIAHALLGKLMTGNLDDLFDHYLDGYLNNTIDPKETYGAGQDGAYHELKRTYSLYNWEAGFHAPMLLTDRLLKAQLFDQALAMAHYVFNPQAKGTDGKRYWQFPPFREVDPEKEMEKLLEGLQPGVADDRINEWREHPFQPHVVARSRSSAYMKWVVMKYIEILIAYGDYYFRQNTLETIPYAIQCYVMASHLFGPRGQKIPRRGRIRPQTYNGLLDQWDAFSNAMVELELAFPFSNQTQTAEGTQNGKVGLANVFGFATSLYFCIPDNPKLRQIRDTIDDRLFKLRHCQDIEGVFRKLPLFEPPIDPALLVQAAAQGLSLASVLNELNSPMPNYRFYYLLQKALEMCSELKSLGNAFLSAKEKKDGEALSKLRARHESSIHNLVMEVRKQQLEEAQKSVEALQQSRKGPVYRMQHFLKLIGEDLGKVPDGATDFSELAFAIETPINESGLKLGQYEKEEMDKAGAAADWQMGIGVVETLASTFHALPTFSAAVHPFGVGADVQWGFPNLGNATSAVARGLRIHADHLSYQSSTASRKAGFLRQLQDRVQQTNSAGYEVKNIDKQILTQQIRISMAQQEITNQQKQIDNAQEVEEFLRNKYTHEELYSWMEGSVRTLYYQVYTQAYDLAKKAEKVFRFERGLSTTNFIEFGYWEAAHDGLLAGERLFVGLKQLESAYQEKRSYDYEISKPISLRQVNPLAFLRLRETGTCEFALPEVLFDMDYAGHYQRRIKSVSLTVPSVIGPYTSLNCTLRLLEHKFRINALAKDKNDYREKTDEADDRFTTINVPITAIAVSTGQNDSGVFELNFKDERYIPFEGAGATSRWRLELPAQFRQFDYDTISDVIMHLRYTAVEGGDKLKAPAIASVQEYIKSVEDLSRQEGLYAAFDLKHDFPNEWYKANHPPAGATQRLLPLGDLHERLPIFTRGRDPAKIRATEIYLFTSAALPAAALGLTQATDEYVFSEGPPEGTMRSFSLKGIRPPMSGWQLRIQDTGTEISKLWLIVRYVLE